MALESKEEDTKSDLERDLHLCITSRRTKGNRAGSLPRRAKMWTACRVPIFMGKVDIELQSLLKEPKRRSQAGTNSVP